MDKRLKLSKADQETFIAALKKRSGLTWKNLAIVANTSEKTLRDWGLGKFNPSYRTAVFLSRKFAVPLPTSFIILAPLWNIKKAGRMGALKRQEMYGSLGNFMSRQKGGVVSQERRRQDPERYRKMGCIVKKHFSVPKHSEKLAELVGIILGDGAINDSQLRISLDKKVDQKYAKYVRALMEEIFNERPSVMERSDNTINLTLSGVVLVEVLEKIGLRRGNKILHQVGFPGWILKESRYSVACSRGLFDTDGGLYFHHHKKWEDKRPYLGWCFTSYSEPLIKGFLHSLSTVGLRAKEVAGRHLYMYSIEDIVRYMKLVGSSNPKIWEKLKYYLGLRDYAKNMSVKHGLRL